MRACTVLSGPRSVREPSQPLARHKDEKCAEGRVDQDGDHRDHDGTSHQQFADVRLSYAGESERSVLAQSDEGEHRIQRVLIGGEAVYSDGERDDELEIGSAR